MTARSMAIGWFGSLAVSSAIWLLVGCSTQPGGGNVPSSTEDTSYTVEAPQDGQVRVTESGGEKTTVIELKVATSDLGKIIGRQGRTAKAIRTVLNGASTKMGRRTVLEILD